MSRPLTLGRVGRLVEPTCPISILGSVPLVFASLFALGLDPEKLINRWGLVGIAIIVFAESGLLIGFFLPGDSLLFTAGLLAARGTLPNIVWVAGTC